MIVKDIMTSNVRTCTPESNLAAAAKLMWEADCGALPVVEDGGKVFGMITDRDICIAVATKFRLASDIPVREVASGKVYSCTPDEDIKAALRTMQNAKVRRLPVVNRAGVLQGILSLNDVAMHTGKVEGRKIPDLSYEDTANTLKAICEHRILKPSEEQASFRHGASA